jgi:hypothetical protein
MEENIHSILAADESESTVPDDLLDGSRRHDPTSRQIDRTRVNFNRTAPAVRRDFVSTDGDRDRALPRVQAFIGNPSS